MAITSPNSGEYINLGIKQAVKEALSETLPQIIKELEKRELKLSLPKTVKTGVAARFLGISVNTLKSRVHSGVYHEGRHFKLINGKIRHWDRDTLIEIKTKGNKSETN